MPPIHGPVVIRRRLGSALKRLRNDRGLHLDTVARQLEVSPSKLSRLETGQVEPKIRDVRDLLDIYDAGTDVREEVMRWATDAKRPGWWEPFPPAINSDLDLYISLESEARSTETFCTPILGLLQTESYAREILEAALPRASKDEINALVNVRIGRQRVVAPDRDDAPPLTVDVVIDESALYRGPLSGNVMPDQLRELLVRSEQPNITVRVLPFRAGYTMATSTFTIFEPRSPEDWTVVNIESSGLDAYYDSPTDVEKYRGLWEGVCAKALDPAESRSLISTVLRGR